VPQPAAAKPPRLVLTVGPCAEGWGVERDGAWSGHSRTRDEAKAAANKQARELMDAGHPCQVVVQGETGYFAAARR